MKQAILLVAICAVSTLSGCTISGKPGGKFGVKWHIVETVVDAILPCDEPDTAVDRQWREGYGYNNPNPERRRKNLPPLNFDGSEYRD